MALNKIHWQTIKNKILAKSDSVLGIDIGTGSIKIVEIKRKNERAVVTKIAVADFDAVIFDDSRLLKPELTAMLRRQVATNGFNSCRAVTAIGGRSIFIRQITVPPMTEGELREAIKWELEKYIPYAPDNCYYDFAVLGAAGSGIGLRVLLAAAIKDHIDTLVTVLKDCGLQPIAIDGEAFALYRSLRNAENSLLLDIGQHLTQLIIYQQGIPEITRNIPLAGRRFTELLMKELGLDAEKAEQWKQVGQDLLPPVSQAGIYSPAQEQMLLLVAELAREIRRTIEVYQSQHKEAAIEKIIVGGGGASLPHLVDRLKLFFDIPVILHDAAAAIEHSPAVDAGYLQDIGPRLGVAVGLALRGGTG